MQASDERCPFKSHSTQDLRPAATERGWHTELPDKKPDLTVVVVWNMSNKTANCRHGWCRLQMRGVHSKVTPPKTFNQPQQREGDTRNSRIRNRILPELWFGACQIKVQIVVIGAAWSRWEVSMQKSLHPRPLTSRSTEKVTPWTPGWENGSSRFLGGIGSRGSSRSQLQSEGPSIDKGK